MSKDRAQGRSFFVTNGNVRTTGGNNQLTKGQLAIVDLMSSGADGAKVLGTFLGIPKDKKKLAIQLGNPTIKPTRSFSNKNQSTAPFSLSEIKKLRVSVPQHTEMSMDELILGYDGFNANTSFDFKTGQQYLSIYMRVRNGAVQYLGENTDYEDISVHVEIPTCDPYDTCADCDTCAAVDCQAVTLTAIEALRNKQLTGGTLLSELVDITPVFADCTTAATNTLIPYTYHTLDVCDTGDAEALALVAAQYDVPVIRIARNGSITTYQMLLADSEGAPADFETSIASVIKGCETCPAGYTAVEGGYLYSITIEDSGVDRTAVITASLASAKLVAGTVLRASGNNGGIGYYTAIYSSPITAAEIASFVGVSTNARNTATIDLVGDVHDFCSNATTTTEAWVAGDTCNAVSETYSIVLPDNECGGPTLELLQASTVTPVVIADSPTVSNVTVTLTGTSGTADINVATVNYTATFATDLTTTAANFVTTHAAALLTAGVTVTSTGATLNFDGLTALVTGVTVTNATGDLAGTVAAVVASDDRKNCSTRYQTSVISNLVCEECSPIFLDYYKTSAPDSFGSHKWNLDANQLSNPTGDCLCGIRVKGKPFLLSAEDALAGEVAFTESATEVQISGGFSMEIREAIGDIPKGEIPVYEVSRFSPRSHLFGNLRDIENEGNVYFRARNYQNSYLTRVILGESPAVMDNLKQAVVFYLEVDHSTHSNGFGGKHESSISYEIYVEYGRHQDVMTLLNNLAANAGVPPVVMA